MRLPPRFTFDCSALENFSFQRVSEKSKDFIAFFFFVNFLKTYLFTDVVVLSVSVLFETRFHLRKSNANKINQVGNAYNNAIFFYVFIIYF